MSFLNNRASNPSHRQSSIYTVAHHIQKMILTSQTYLHQFKNTKIPYKNTTPHSASLHKHTIAHHSISHHTKPHHTTPHHTTSYHTTQNHTKLHHTTLHHTTPHHTTPHHTTPHHTTPYHFTPHHTSPHKHTTSYHTLPHNKNSHPDTNTSISSFQPSIIYPALQYFRFVQPRSVAQNAGLASGDFLLEVRKPAAIFNSKV